MANGALSQFWLIGLATIFFIKPNTSQTGVCYWGPFNLTSLNNESIVCRSVDTIGSYYYSPCGNRITCRGGIYSAAYYQGGICSEWLDIWDSGATLPDYSTMAPNGNDTWSFEYYDGETTEQCQGGMTLFIQWICNE
eukprot:830707_1